MSDSVVTSATSRPRFLQITAVTLLMVGTACAKDNSGLLPADSALQRDLTLAASAERPSGALAELGDTAQSAPRSPSPAGSPTNRAEPQSPPKRTPAPARVPSQSTTAPAPAPVEAPVAATPAPVDPTPAPPAPGGTGSGSRSIGAGTALIASTATQLCSLANRPGDRIVATLNSAVTGPDGATLPAGTPIVVEMAVAEPPADFAFRVKGVQVDGKFIPAEGRVTSDGATTDRRVSKGGDKGKVATGAIIGAILGRVLGGSTKGTVIGAAGGAAAGSVVAARNSTVEHCLPAGATITVTLASPLVLPSTPL